MIQLHGTPGGRLVGATEEERLVRQGLRLITPERPGYGASDPRPGRTVVDDADDVVAVMDACQVDRAVVIGGSGGGPHALAMGAAAPDRVLAVGVLVGATPSLLPDEVELLVGVNRQVHEHRTDPAALRQLLGPVREAILRDGLASVVPDAAEADREKIIARAAESERAVRSALDRGVEGMVDDYVALWGKPWGFELSSVAAPVVWAHGLQDHFVPHAAAARTAAHLPDCRFVTWSDAGHIPSPELVGEFRVAVLGAALAGAGLPPR
ncbi:alpha/beta fold hydrolase [Aeromicrobium endophyticum]|uniref:alpha/beta fold hydrolase n=1 Tax=Aeromicrobium endophyticum TaxID=2292704 RepID=UPI001314213D|nr:alpha/beta fold hydrolase [Aeromicrobium endophyticum]